MTFGHKSLKLTLLILCVKKVTYRAFNMSRTSVIVKNSVNLKSAIIF